MTDILSMLIHNTSAASVYRVQQGVQTRLVLMIPATLPIWEDLTTIIAVHVLHQVKTSATL